MYQSFSFSAPTELERLGLKPLAMVGDGVVVHLPKPIAGTFTSGELTELQNYRRVLLNIYCNLLAYFTNITTLLCIIHL